MKKSKKPRKQRKTLYEAPLHKRRKMISSHLSSKYLEDIKHYYPRSVIVRKGDTVKIVRGSLAGHMGKVESIDTRSMRITVDGATISKADGTQIAVKIHPSNVIITKLDLSDTIRKKKLEELSKE
ncbi:MAG: 50S ribosomal protein L24 [Methanomassiliicoccales archaeon]|nr:MAG: 50S ribosomal protein L24 [Methanomassiliicoccales archaeon]